MSRSVPAVVLGGSGYVAGEVVRLLAAHPGFDLAAVVSESRAGTPVAESFPHLAGTIDGLDFADFSALAAVFADAARELRPCALISAAPHGASAALVARALELAERAGVNLSVVDLSADFRFSDEGEYAAVYGQPHPAPELLPRFVRALPEHLPLGEPMVRENVESIWVAHPGCFTTAVLLAVVPLLAEGLASPRFAVTAITGSTGSGRGLSEKTHHPARRSNVAAYSPLAHRHAPEMAALAGEASGIRPEIDFVPLSGPQARGIYACVQGRLAESSKPAAAGKIAAALNSFYAECPFVSVVEAPPALTDVVGTNRARSGVASAGGSFAITVAIDNLVKGAAGGGVQWLNRIHGFEETTGLGAASLGWF